MNNKEICLFKELCKFKSDTLNEDLLKYATPEVLGHLFFNRMQGVAYHILKKHGLLGKVNREFRNSLKFAYEQNIERNESFNKCLSYLSDILLPSGIKLAMLKGAILRAQYPMGCRTSNDVDLLVLPHDATKIGDILTKAGFEQGNIRNDVFVPATRKEIIESKMTRGETVPYIKQVDLPYMKYFEVDINFSLDYKNGETDMLAKILNESFVIESYGVYIPTLSKEDFFIHLCAHLHKEATTLPWIEMHRDMTLYKYCDIYMLITQMTDLDFDKVFVRAKEFGMEKICAYAIFETAGLFDFKATKPLQLVCEAFADDLDFVLQVVDPKRKTKLLYQTHDVTERFFMDERKKDLKEVD